MVSCTQKYSTSQYVLIHTMIYNVYLSIYFNIQGISLYILAYQMDNIWQALYPWTAQTPIPQWIHTLQKPTDIYYFNTVYTRIPVYSYVLCISVYILLYTVIYTDIYYFKKVYTWIYSYVLCISVYILLYTVIYGHILLQQSIYSYILVCALHICVYTLIYCDIRTYTTSTKYILVYTRMYSVYLCIYYWIPHPGTFPGTWTCPFLEI